MRLSIRTKLVLLLFFLIFIAVALISGQAYRIALKDMSNNAKANTRMYAKNISDVIQERLDAVKEKVLMAQMNENLLRSSSSVIFERSPELLSITKYFFDTPYSAPSEQGFFINPTYHEKQSLTKDNFTGLEKAIDFKSLFKNNEYLGITKLPNYQSDVLIYAFPVKATGDQGLYVFAAAVSPNLIMKTIDSGSSSKDGVSTQSGSKYINYLVDNKGRILVHPDKTQLTKNIYNLAISKDFFSTDIITEKTSEYTDENDQEVIGSIFKIKGSNIGIVSKILSKDAYSEAQKLKKVFIITTLFAFFISLIIGLYFAKTLSAPLLKLAKVTGEIARGNFLVKVDVNSKDEIGELANSFGKMGTELYNREQELNAAHSALIQSEKMSAFGQISAGIAHEVKNPLTGILGHAQLTKEKMTKMYGQIPPDIDNSLEIIEKETKRCKMIIENLMKFSRQEKTQFVEEDISAVVRGAIALVDHQLTTGGVKIFQEVPDGFPKVMCSANQIEQVMMNIMLNAQHAMETRPEKKITVRLKQGKTGYARIEIEDTGTGIPEDVKKRIFEPFFTTKPAGKGTGLGLSVSYGIVKDHKGVLDVESKEGLGTTFIIQLPYKDPAAIADLSKLTMPKEVAPVKAKPSSPVQPVAQAVPTHAAAAQQTMPPLPPMPPKPAQAAAPAATSSVPENSTIYQAVAAAQPTAFYTDSSPKQTVR
ncbi:MAG: ATP-binding protein [bacterium]